MTKEKNAKINTNQKKKKKIKKRILKKEKKYDKNEK